MPFKFSFLKDVSLQVFAAVLIGWLSGDYLSERTISIFYTISYNIKDILMFLIPFIILSYLWAALITLKQGSSLKIILILLICIIISNGLSAFASYGVSVFSLAEFHKNIPQNLNCLKSSIKPLWNTHLPMIPAEYALFAGLFLGLLSNSFIKHPRMKITAFYLRDLTTIILRKTIIPLLPLYVFGFVIKLNYDNFLEYFIKHYNYIFMLTIILIIGYVILFYAFAAKFKWKTFIEYIKRMLPPSMIAFGTMSSAAAMPLTIEATEKNLKERDYADFVIPTTVNTHLLGDGLCIPIILCAIIVMTGSPLPSLSQYLYFLFFYVFYKFTSAAIPGGGAVVIVPITEAYLDLTPELSSIFITLYILQDSIITATNVMGNGAFAILTSQFFKKLKMI
ncbi:MAG: cation:dicarboxylate symporter family transporter [Alphaproteobacteria bacterium]